MRTWKYQRLLLVGDKVCHDLTHVQQRAVIVEGLDVHYLRVRHRSCNKLDCVASFMHHHHE